MKMTAFICLSFAAGISFCTNAVSVNRDPVLFGAKKIVRVQSVDEGTIHPSICDGTISGSIDSVYSSGEFPGFDADVPYGSSASVRNLVAVPNSFVHEIKVSKHHPFGEPEYITGFGDQSTVDACSALVGWALDSETNFEMGTYFVFARVHMLVESPGVEGELEGEGSSGGTGGGTVTLVLLDVDNTIFEVTGL